MHNPTSDLLYSIFPNSNKYLTYSSGNSPIILSAPHGGNISPLSIPKRKYGNLSRDTYTRRLIQLVIEGLDEKPYYIYSNIHRNRVDLNRDITEGVQENKKADQIWRKWNTVISNYTAKVRTDYNRGLYLDIHSHNNSKEFQIGYGLSVRDYLDLRDRFKTYNKSTMFSLAGNGVSENSLCFGYGSIISTLKYNGFSVLTPKDDRDYLNGGRNIQRFSGEGIGAIQIECPIKVLKNDLDGVANSIVEFIKLFRIQFF